MSEDGPFKPAPDPSATGAPTPDLEDQIDHLLTEVEALTNDVLGGDSPSAAAATPNAAPADDAGLALESALIQDGERIPVDEIVAEVDLELEKVDRMVRQIGYSGEAAPPEEVATDDLEVLDEELRTLEARAAAGSAHAAPEDATPPERDPRVERGRKQEHPAFRARVPDVADEIPSEPSAHDASSSRSEQQLDADLEALSPGPSAPAAKPAAPSRQAASSKPAASSMPAEPGGGTGPDEPAVWPLVRRRLRGSLSRWKNRLVGGLRDSLAGLLDLMDRPFGRLSPVIKELIGYCALGTLAMCLVAAALLWLLQRG